jgi:hypothetical protein
MELIWSNSRRFVATNVSNIANATMAFERKTNRIRGVCAGGNTGA